MGWSYAPDLPTETPNTWRVIDGFHPTPSGAYRSGWLPTNVSISTGAAVPFQRGFAYKNASGSAQFLLTYLSGNSASGNSYVFDTSWNDRKGANSQFATCFVQVGNITLAGGYEPRKPATLTGLVQRDATGAANFAAVAGSPNAGVLMVNALNIVMALDTASDAYATSDSLAPTTWSGGEASSGNVRLTPGNFTAGVAFGNDFICFKERGVYRATYVGGQVKWVFSLIPGGATLGAWAPGCVVEGAGKVYFIGKAGFWAFDGQGFERLDYGVSKTLVGILGVAVTLGPYFRDTSLVWDSVTQTVFLFQFGSCLVTTDARISTGNRFFSFNTISKKWGYQGRLSEDSSKAIQSAFNIAAFNDYVTSVVTDGDGRSLYATDVGVFSSTDDKVMALHTAFNATDLPGTNYKPNIRSSRYGRRDRETAVSGFIPNWTLEDGNGTDLSTATVKTATFYASESTMEGSTARNTVTLTTNQYRAYNQQVARWHNVELKVNASVVIDGGTWVGKDGGTD
jgi:hypothetical protein